MAAATIILPSGTVPATPAASTISLYSNGSNVPAFVNPSGVAIALSGGSAATNSTPADPTGTSNTTGLMAGCAGTFTPATTGRMLLMAALNGTNSTATAGDGVKCQLRYGTGSAPANAGALVGTAVGNICTMVLMRATASDLQSLTCIAIVTGLTLGTVYWLDLSEAAIVAGTGQLKNISLVAIEI